MANTPYQRGAVPPTPEQIAEINNRRGYNRQEDAVIVKVSPGQAAAVQSGKAPTPTTQSPLINEPEAPAETA